MDRALADLIRMSRSVGGDSALVRGGGGNTSVKADDGKHMYIKASGTAIKDIDAKRGWRRLNLDSLRAILSDGWIASLPEAKREAAVVARLQLCCEDGADIDARPSVESHLHALLGRCVAHLHPTAVLAYVCAKSGKRELEKLWPDDRLPPLWVSYANPGYLLAKRVARLVGKYASKHGRKPGVLFLEKHGLLVTADNPAEVLATVERVISALSHRLPRPAAAKPRRPSRESVTEAKLAIRRALFDTTGQRLAVKHCLHRDVAGFLARRDAKELAAWPALTPDELVYANGSPLWLEKIDAKEIARGLKRRIDRGERPAAIFLAKGIGLFAAGNESMLELVSDTGSASLVIRGYAAAYGGAKPLTRRERDFIDTWEAESYRQRVAGWTENGELEGRIALVTGAGSGLGRGIATGLAQAGAAVALVDIDGGAAARTAALIRAKAPGASGLPVKCDVTSSAQVRAAVRRVLDKWGGLDILVNAAGIAPAYELIELPVAEWRRTLEVNLTGYFLMAQAAAKIMTRQGMGGSIINLSSKSGIEASRSNTAYNATKSGEIHMARGWALELGKHGIRVNSVAPGNVFEDSKIWNPQYIRACARKYGISPREVISYYVDRTALKTKITGQDVAEAVVFLCSDRARTITGQTVVPDGGQVMVR